MEIGIILIQWHEQSRSLIDKTSITPSNLKAYSAISLAHGKSLHAFVIKRGVESSTSIGNFIMEFYTKVGDIGSTISVFGCMKISYYVSWNILIFGQIDDGDLDQGIRYLLKREQHDLNPMFLP